MAYMPSNVLRMLRTVRDALASLRSFGLRVVLAAVAVQATLVGGLAAVDEIRKRREGPKEGFPWVEQPEVELESGGRLKLYPYGVRLYEAMIEEIQRAESRVFLGTFIWKGDEIGRRFVQALAHKAGEGVQVCVIFDGLANVVVPPSFKRFPEEIQTLHFRPLWGPTNGSRTRATSSGTTATSWPWTGGSPSWADTTSARSTRRAGATPTFGSRARRPAR
jgi:cardiolipin synthase